MNEIPHLQAPATPFYGAPVWSHGDERSFAFAFLGLPVGSPYDPARVPPAAGAADHVRSMAVEQECAPAFAAHYDYDIGGPLMPSGAMPQLVDCGDITYDTKDANAGKAYATSVVRQVVERGALPMVIGGDHSITPIVVRAFEGVPRLNILHIDAHLDFREEVGGVSDGYSSPIRRLRDAPWIGTIVQVGLRGVGSARATEVEAAQRAGNRTITAAELHCRGVEAVCEELSLTDPWYVTIDVDGLDPTIAPGTGYPVPGGVGYEDAAALIRHLGLAGVLAGIDIAEICPAFDVRGLTGITVVRLLSLVMGFAVRGAKSEERVLPFSVR